MGSQQWGNYNPISNSLNQGTGEWRGVDLGNPTEGSRCEEGSKNKILN